MPGGVAAAVRRRVQQRWGLWAGAALLVVPWAVAAPVGDDRIVASSAVSVAFFATILTGEAVIFAIAFSASSSWPSLREIDGHIAFREWVVIGWLAAMLLGAGLLVGDSTAATCGALLFLVADLFGIFSFVRLFGLASAGGRRRLLRRTLEARLLATPGSVAGMAGRVSSDEVVVAFLREVDGAVAAGDANGVRDLVEELTATASTAGEGARAGLHLDLLHRLVRAVFSGRLEAGAGARCAQQLVDSLLAQVAGVGKSGAEGGLDGEAAGALAGHLGRYLAWVGASAHLLAVRHVTAAAAARELVALSVRARDEITFTLDPDPPYAASAQALGSPLDSPLAVIAWIRQYVEFHGSAQANALYPAFELLSGTKFHGNYWDGASVLTGLRDALFGPPGQRVTTLEAERARAAFGDVVGFDRVWTLVSVGAVATLRDVRLPHPLELVRPEFTPDVRLLRAYLRSWATHRYFAGTDDALAALYALAGHTEDPDGLWARSTVLLRTATYPEPLPVVEPRQRLAAAVLAIALRLAPLQTDHNTVELRTFLEALSDTALHGAHALAQRVLPATDSAPAVSRGPVEDLVARLEIVRMGSVGVPAQVALP